MELLDADDSLNSGTSGPADNVTPLEAASSEYSAVQKLVALSTSKYIRRCLSACWFT
jgi:hypothetical protein